MRHYAAMLCKGKAWIRCAKQRPSMVAQPKSRQCTGEVLPSITQQSNGMAIRCTERLGLAKAKLGKALRREAMAEHSYDACCTAWHSNGMVSYRAKSNAKERNGIANLRKAKAKNGNV